jgi:hypothetical protein
MRALSLTTPVPARACALPEGASRRTSSSSVDDCSIIETLATPTMARGYTTVSLMRAPVAAAAASPTETAIDAAAVALIRAPPPRPRTTAR